ncbi:MAG TPA: hemerythrin domain-containing protein [Actinocrinis sp.]|nr:hemerythrin domain-containing protein [Actinocrinis sp.]
MNPSQQTGPGQPASAVLSPVSVIDVLLEQHARIRELFAQVDSAQGPAKQAPFDELRELLAVHEAGEEMVLRPVTKTSVGEDVAQACNDEEKRAAQVLAELEKLDVASVEFAERFAAFELDVSNHAAYEEGEEFPYVLARCDLDQQEKMAVRLVDAQRTAPTHPHPATAGSTAAQYATAPFVALLDRARDAFSSNSSSGS